ncbi:MAG: hypothetical protein KF901_24710 [Myxococcales bacterium]|nr:hypothetical protein [Myxococcales bacterium]
MLERAALHQTRFRTPGVAPDARGVVLGQRGVVLFPSLDRLVAFLRAYGDEGSLDELLPTLQLRRLVTPLKTREIMLSVGAESSYRMDRIAGVAKLAGGLVFTGTSRHFVKYRDSSSPLGFDVLELLDQPADLVLYHDTFRQAYTFERELQFRDLVFRLHPFRQPHASATPLPPRLWASAEVGVGGAILSYLFRWQIPARAAIAEWPATSAFDDRPRRLYLFDIGETPERVARLFAALPGVHVFEPLGKSFAVELGFRHPIALESCASMFDDQTLHLFRGDGEVLVVHPLPPFAPVRSLVRTGVDLEGDDAARAHRGAGLDASIGLGLPLRLAHSTEPWRAVTATVVPLAQREHLARMLYALPPNTLSALRLAIGEDRFYLLDPKGIEGVPLGVFHSEVAPRIYVPSGSVIVPAVSPTVLEELVRDRGDGYVFFEGGPDGIATPRVVPAGAFGPVSRKALRDVAAHLVRADRPVSAEIPLPLLQYDEPRRFPLWGLPDAGSPKTGEGE